MKIIVTLFALLFISLAFAKDLKRIDHFNEAMIKSIDRVIEHNPQDYETRPILERNPASIEVIDSEELQNIQEFSGTNIGHPII